MHSNPEAPPDDLDEKVKRHLDEEWERRNG